MSAKFQIEGSGAGAIDLIRKLNKALDGTEEGFDKAAKGSARAEAAAKRLVDSVATPMERYKDKVDKLAEAVKKGHITQEQATVAADRYHKKMVESNPKIAEAAANQKKLKDETDRAAAAMKAQGEKIRQSVETPMERYKRQLLEVGKLLRSGAIDQETFVRKARELKAGMVVASDAFKEVETSQKSAFGSAAIARIAAYGAGMLSVGSIIAGVKRGFMELERQAQASADASFTAFSSMAQLQQVSATPEEFTANVGFARSLITRGIVSKDQQGLAADISYSLAGADFTAAEKELVASAGEAGFIKPEDLATVGEALRTYQRSFGEAEAGDLAAILDKGIIGGKATKVDTTKTLLAATKFGAGSTRLGFSDEESLAALVVNEFQAENIDIAATQVSSLYDQLNKRGLGKGSLNETIASIKARVDKGENVFDILGESRAVKGYEAIAGSPELFSDTFGKMVGASGAFQASQGMVDSDPILAAGKLRREAEGRLAMQMEDLHAERESLFNAMIADQKANFGANNVRAYALYGVSGLLDTVGAEDWYMRQELANDDTNRRLGRQGTVSPEVRAKIEDYLERQARAAERTADATEAMQRNGRPTTTRQE